MRILIIEDDEATVETVRLTFQVGWPSVEIISSGRGEEGLQMVESRSPDAVILDLGLPDTNGFEILKAIRLFSKVPVVVLTVQTDERSVIKALETGADDYVTKPFRQLELLARIKSAIRSRHSDSLYPLSTQPFDFDPSGRKMRYRNKDVSLTSTEFVILRLLAINKGKLVSHIELARKIWGSEYPGYDRTLRVYVSHLRKKLEIIDPVRIIMSEPSKGYYLSPAA